MADYLFASRTDNLLSTPFLSLAVDSQGERGLLGVAFDPNFSANNFVYIYYTTPGPPVHNRVSRVTASGDVAAGGSEVVLFELDSLSTATNHNGGAIHFGRDGKLYAGVGENANSSNAQSLSTVLGKILRINSDGSIPTDNPFFTQTTGKYRAIWAIGLRNPFTFNFQPGTGRLFINDVGEVTWEEVNEGTAGANYGWPTCEGVCVGSQPQLTNPIFAYSHAATGGCAITGGTFYNPSASNFPSSYVGKYLFADLCGGFVRVMDPDSHNVSTFATGLQQPVDLQVGPDGALYYLQIGNGGQVWRVSFNVGQSTSATAGPVQAFLPPLRVPATDGTDFDGDGKTDLAVFRRTDGIWLVRRSSDGGTRTQQWGAPGDIPVPGDYDGDGKSDFAVWRRSEGTWYVVLSSNGATTSRQWGAPGDIPVPGDYDGDGKTDLAVWRRTTGTWYVIQSSSGAMTAQQWGTPGDIPIPGDYDGDGRTDLAIWRESEGAWYVIQSSDRLRFKKQWGLPGDLPFAGDFDGDKKSDFIVWRESEGIWYVLQSSNGASITRKWGVAGDIPVPGDYDGDGKSDFAIWRESEGTWYVIQSSNGATTTQSFGSPGDRPVSVPTF
jgi:glucose/arabinose dehydrogenase